MMPGELLDSEVAVASFGFAVEDREDLEVAVG